MVILKIQEIKHLLSKIHESDITNESAIELKNALNVLIKDYSLRSKEESLLDQVMQTFLKLFSVPVAIVYSNLESKITSISAGTGILLSLKEKFLVTNKHVIDFYRNQVEIATINNLEQPLLQVGGLIVNLEDKILDENETLDLTTIKLSEGDLKLVGKHSYKEFFSPNSKFVQSDVTKDKAVIIIGYPGVYRLDLKNYSCFQSATATLEIMDANEKTAYIELDLNNVYKAFGYDDPEKLKQSLGGFSGGGVFSLASNGDVQLLGIIKEDGSGLFNGVQASYAYLINEDGTINSKFDLER